MMSRIKVETAFIQRQSVHRNLLSGDRDLFLKTFNWLHKAHSHYGTQSALLRVYLSKCYFHTHLHVGWSLAEYWYCSLSKLTCRINHYKWSLQLPRRIFSRKYTLLIKLISSRCKYFLSLSFGHKIQVYSAKDLGIWLRRIYVTNKNFNWFGINAASQWQLLNFFYFGHKN